MGEIVDLKPASLIENREFISDMCRFQEQLLTEKSIRKKYRLFNEAAWEKLNDDELVRAIEEESIRRIRDGSAKREKSQALVVKAPDVAASIMLNDSANDRHRLDACKVLNDFSANGPQGAPPSDRFSIVINLGADLEGRPIVEKYDRSIKVDVDDIDPNHIDDTPKGPWPVIAANRRKDDGGNGEPV